MSRSRYTGKMLENDVAGINASLKKEGINCQYLVGYSYGRTQVMECYTDEKGKFNINRTIESGSPRECYERVNSHVTGVRLHHMREKIKKMEEQLSAKQ